MNTELTVIDPKEYGLEVEKVKTIDEAFSPSISERNILNKMYSTLIRKEITEELSIEAKVLRNKLVKVRTGIEKVHNSQKAFFLASGRYVDAWRKKETEPVLQMEAGLKEIENHFKKIEEERLLRIHDSRVGKLKELKSLYLPENLGLLSEEAWEEMYRGQELVRKDELERLEKEKEEKEESDRISKVQNSRLSLLLNDNLHQYLDKDLDTESLGVMPDEEWVCLIDSLTFVRDKEYAENERIRKENETLKAKEKVKEEEIRVEKVRTDKIISDAKSKEESDRENREKLERIEIAKRESLEAKLKAKEDAEKADKEEKERLADIELSKGDSEKVIDLIADLTEIKSRYTFKSKKYKRAYADTGVLIDKVINHINKEE